VPTSNAQGKAQGKKAQKKMKKKKSATVTVLEPEGTETLLEPDLDLEPEPDLEPESEPEPEPEVETDAQHEARERFALLQALRTVAMKDWTAEQAVSWVQLAELPATIVDQVQTYVIDDDIDGEELEALIQKGLQKTLKKAKFEKPEAMAQSILAKRDQMLEWQAADDADGVVAVAGEVRVGPIVFNEQSDHLGSGRFGFVFKCKLIDTGEELAVKRVEKLRFEAEGGKREIDVLLHAQATDDGGHRNIIRYVTQVANDTHVHIVMGLCDETLEDRIRRNGLNDQAARLAACTELCEGLLYLHTLAEAITHRDLKPSNILFKGSVLKIADMGQSRVLAQGETAVATGSQGGTQGCVATNKNAVISTCCSRTTHSCC
jgi:hypothetical protein